MTVKLNSLQALRGLAATTVVLSHFMRQTHEDWVRATAPDLHASALGDLGVFVFFIISGFIMQHTAGGAFGQPGAARRFIERRIARVVPIYWMFTALAVAFPGAVYLGTHRTAIGIISSFAFLPDMSAPPFQPALVVGWTLSFEMLFYAAFAICLNFQRRTGIALLVAGFLGFSLLMMGIAHTVPAVRDFAQWWGRPLSTWFIAGVLFAIIRARWQVKDQRALVGFAAGVSLFLAVVLLTTFVSDPIGCWLVVLAPAAVVALCTLQGNVPDSGLMRPLIWLGDRSYTLYLGHLFVLGIASAAWLRLFGANGALEYDAVVLCLCVFLCAPAYRLEVRLTKWTRAVLFTPYVGKPAPLRAASQS
jgi:exopolysaccharide production protein ExoZ